MTAPPAAALSHAAVGQIAVAVALVLGAIALSWWAGMGLGRELAVVSLRAIVQLTALAVTDGGTEVLAERRAQATLRVPAAM